jgi:hypothetical protein
MSGAIKRQLSRLEDAERPGPDCGRQREEERKRRIREQAEHAKCCGWGKEVGRGPLFEIAEGGAGDVFCTHDGKPVTHSHQILSESFYWQALEWGGPGLVYDGEAQAFYTPSGDLALSREYVNLEHLLGRGEGAE